MIRTEKQWLVSAKATLELNRKRRIFEYWKLFGGNLFIIIKPLEIMKFESEQEIRTKIKIIKGFKHEMLCNQRDRQKATSHWWRKGKGKEFFHYWWSLAKPRYEQKKLEQVGSNKYAHKLKTDAISMFKEFIGNQLNYKSI